MKVAISLPEPLLTEAEKLASEMAVTRSRLHSMASAQFLERRGSQSVTGLLNAVFWRDPAIVAPDLAGAQLSVLSNEAW